MKIIIEGTTAEIQQVLGIRFMDPKNVLKHAETINIDGPAKPKERSKKAQADINAIKAAYYKNKTKYGDAIKHPGPPRKEIDVNEVVRLIDEEGLSYSAVGRVMGVSYKTIIDRYREAKG